MNNEISKENMVPVLTPWGVAQRLRVLAEGIIWYETAVHGGIWLSEERNKKIPRCYRSGRSNAPGGWYEEDDEAMIVYKTFRISFK